MLRPLSECGPRCLGTPNRARSARGAPPAARFFCGALAALVWFASSGERLAAQAHTHALRGLLEAPFPAVGDEPQAFVVRPRGAATSSDVVLYLHGYDGCITAIVSSAPTRCGQTMPAAAPGHLREAFEESSVDASLVVVQLAFRQRDGSPGRFRREGQVARFLAEVLARSAQVEGHTDVGLGRVTVVAHSAGFETALHVVRSGGLGERLHGVVLLDAMYSGGPAFLHWVSADPQRSFVALHTPSGAPARQAQALRALAARHRTRFVDRLESLRAGSIALVGVRGRHAEVPERYLGRVLRALSAP